jgi:son of sevenless-like protein
LEELQLDFQETQVNLLGSRNDEKGLRKEMKGPQTRLRDPKPLPSPPESASSDSQETKVEPIPINKPTRPNDDDRETADPEEAQFPDPVRRSHRRRPLLIKNSVSLNQLSGLLELRSPHEIDLVMIPGLNGFGDGFDTIVANSRADRINKIKAIDNEALTLFNERIAQSHLPWYLRPKYTHDDIKFGNDSNVKAGTLTALIERLTVEPLSMLCSICKANSTLTFRRQQAREDFP